MLGGPLSFSYARRDSIQRLYVALQTILEHKSSPQLSLEPIYPSDVRGPC